MPTAKTFGVRQSTSSDRTDFARPSGRSAFSSIMITIAALLAPMNAHAQNADTSNNIALSGDYFVRELQMAGNSSTGLVNTATSVIGVVTFDGKGNYTFKGQSNSLTGGSNASLSVSGTYGVGANGFLRMESIAAPTDFDYGGIAAVGPAAFIASATEGSNITMLVGIQAGTSATNASFKGSYTAASIDFPAAATSSVRQATFNLTADGAGNLGSVAMTGVGANLGGTSLNQTASGVTYTLSGEGSGTIAFGSASTSQLVSGTKTFYISGDGSIILGGSATGFDLIVGLRGLSGPASNSTASGIYYMGALETQINNGIQPTVLDAFYGSANSTGSGLSLFHNRIQSLLYNVFDFTYDAQYTIQTDGTIPFGGSSTPYEFIYGAGGKAFLAIGNAADSSLFSLTLGLAETPASTSAPGVYLNPAGVVNSASFAPLTNPIAPNEFVTLVGTGLAGTTTTATTLPLPTSLGNVQVSFNGIFAPLAYTSATQIIALVPSSISPVNNAPYATVQVINNNAKSNSVTVYTNNTSPGVFAYNPGAVGSAAAEHPNFAVIGPSSPAAVGETVTLYLSGLGPVNTPVIPDGGPAPSSPLATVLDPALNVDFSGLAAVYPLPFAGLTPTVAGLYQIDVAIPTGVASDVFVDVGTSDGYTSLATMNVTTTQASAVKAAEATKRLEVKRRGVGAFHEKAAGISLRAQ
jgi:uncharacterized protein (TIGR03437 family)